MQRSILRFALLAALAAPAAAFQTDWYVDAGAAGPGTGSALDPFPAIQAASDASTPGDRILVAPGTYVEQIGLPHELTVVGTGGSGVTTIEGGFWCADGVALSGLSIVGGVSLFDFQYFYTSGLWVPNEATVSIQDVHVRQCNIGVRAGWGGLLTISNSTFEGCEGYFPGPDGVVFSEGQVVARSTLFRNNPSYHGIRAPSLSLRGCMIQGTRVHVVAWSLPSSVRIENSLFLSSPVFGGNSGSEVTIGNCTLDEGSVFLIDNNLFLDATLGFENSILAAALAPSVDATMTYTLVPGGFPGMGNVDGTPRFRNPLGPDGWPGTGDEDLRLAPGSPGIDAGNNALVPADMRQDLLGQPRFLDDRSVPDTGVGPGPIVDLGCFENVLQEWDFTRDVTRIPNPPPGRRTRP